VGFVSAVRDADFIFLLTSCLQAVDEPGSQADALEFPRMEQLRYAFQPFDLFPV
jgi:hypothetical protein